MECRHCAAQVPDDDVFCEVCGKPLAEPDPNGCTCGAPASEIDEEGFCQQCGRRARRPASDHIEVEVSPECAGVSDRGQRHSRNEDRFAIKTAKGVTVMVVCDGVSTSRDPDTAAAKASEAAADALVKEIEAGETDSNRAVRHAISAAEYSVKELSAAHPGSDAPSCTIVAAMVHPDRVTLGWAGDSRAYWIHDGAAEQLTTDHSWTNMMVAAGAVTYEQAQNSPFAHSITKWLGGEVSDNPEPETAVKQIDGPGIILLCSDGLWNYAPDAPAMSKLLGETARNGNSALTIARTLIDFANSQGGQDNITAVLLRRVEAPESVSEEGEEYAEHGHTEPELPSEIDEAEADDAS